MSVEIIFSQDDYRPQDQHSSKDKSVLCILVKLSSHSSTGNSTKALLFISFVVIYISVFAACTHKCLSALLLILFQWDKAAYTDTVVWMAPAYDDNVFTEFSCSIVTATSLLGLIFLFYNYMLYFFFLMWGGKNMRLWIRWPLFPVNPLLSVYH